MVPGEDVEDERGQSGAGDGLDDPQNPLLLLNTSVRNDPRQENQEEQVIGAAVEIRCRVPHLLSPL